MTIEIIPQSGALGAEVRGIDLAKPLDNAKAETIHRAFLDHQVIFFRDQNVSPTQFLEFAHRFGEPAEYPFAAGLPECPLVTKIVKAETETFNFGGEWHSDTSYTETPPQATLLHAKEVPPFGGDTLFANTYQAYDGLSDGMKQLLAPLRAINTASLLPRHKRDGYSAMQVLNADKVDMQAEHPVVRTHDETGRKSLYVNETHTYGFKDMTREESLPLLNYLCSQVTRPEYSFRLRWEVGTLTVWDNRCTQHFAINDYHGHRRVVYRVIARGSRPQ